MKKIIALILCTLIFATVSLGCGKEKSINLSDINNEIAKVVDTGKMRKADAKDLKKIYGLDDSKIDSFVLYRAESNVKADEILLIKVKDKSDIDEIEDKIRKRNDNQAQKFKDYLPDEYAIIQKYILKNKGDIVVYSVSKDADKIEEAFDKITK